MGRLTDDMRRLRGDIDSSRSSRLAQTNEMQNSVKAQLANFASTRIKNGQQDSQARANFVSDMSKATSNLISDFNADRRNMAEQTSTERANFNADRRSMAEQTSAERANFVSEMSKATSNLISDFNADRRNMAEQTSTERANFNADRRSMAEQTSKQRADFITNLSNGVSAFINDIATDRADAHAVFFGTVSKKKTV